MTDPPDHLTINIEDVLDLYRRRVTTALGTATEPSLWEAALADARTAAVQKRADAELDELRHQIDVIADGVDEEAGRG